MAQIEIGYILKQDILRQLFGGTLTELTGGSQAIGDNPEVNGDDDIWRENVSNSIELIKGYSRHWYDMDAEMQPFYEYSATEAATIGQRVASEEVSDKRTLYSCIQNAPAGTFLTDTAFYEQKDDRNQVLVVIAAVLVIYNISKRYNPRAIPEQRRIDFEDAIEQLKDIQNGRIMLDIAERADITEDDPGQEIAFGEFEDLTNEAY